MWENIKAFFQAIINFFYELLITLLTALKDLFLWALEILFEGALMILDGIGTGLDGLNPTQYIDAIPDETKAFMQMSGFNDSISLIVAALTIRILIQLIPFVRWGS